MRFRRFCLPAFALVAALATSAAPAQAGPLVASATDCSPQVYENPFLPWADPMTYVLAPAGTLEDDTSSWSLSGGAAVKAGNEPYAVHGAGEAASLSLPAGSSATTGTMCVGLDHPTIRLFAKNSGSAFSSLQVSVLFEDATGDAHELTIGSVPGTTTSWQPTAPYAIGVNLLALLPGELTPVAFRFTPQGGDWRIDDVYVDPRRGN